jgi:uncharacterized protein with HEPN domain
MTTGAPSTRLSRCLEIVSEASRRLPDELKARHPEIPWRDIAAAGNIYRHQYEDVLEQRVWQTLQHHLAPLLHAVEMSCLGCPTRSDQDGKAAPPNR